MTGPRPASRLVVGLLHAWVVALTLAYLYQFRDIALLILGGLAPG